jgi:hypothetical protein
MRGSSFAGLLTLVALAACESAVAPEPAGLGSTLDPDGAPNMISELGVTASATGGGIDSGNGSLRALTFSARVQGARGAQGHYTVILNGNQRRLAGTRGQLMGNVTCLTVVGNRAFIAGDTKKDELEAFPLPIGGVAIEVVDGGEGPGAMDEVSQVGLYLSVEGANQWCQDAVAGPTFPAEHGQVQVR